MNIVALSGWKGSGKDLVAEYLVEKYGFTRIAFADPLKDTVSQQFNLERKSIDNRFQKEEALLDLPVSPKDAFSLNLSNFLLGEFVFADGSKPTPEQMGAYLTFGGLVDSVRFQEDFGQLYWTRRALCILEGSSKRTADSEFWIKRAVSNMSEGGRYVISDARFKNEMLTLAKLVPNALTIVRIERFESSTSNDPSERDLDNYPFPFTINNKASLNTTVDEVKKQVDFIMSIRSITQKTL